MLGREHHVSRAEKSVGARGENPQLTVAHRQTRVVDFKIHLRAIAPADPISLHFLQRMGPIDRIEVVEQAFGVGGDAEHPLAHRLADHREIAYLAPAIDDFLVGEHRAEGFAPPDGRFGNVSETL